jgi:hypothetical protein
MPNVAFIQCLRELLDVAVAAPAGMGDRVLGEMTIAGGHLDILIACPVSGVCNYLWSPRRLPLSCSS